MNPIDEAILEGLLESRIYAIESNRFLIDGLHRRPFWTEQKFGETWRSPSFTTAISDCTGSGMCAVLGL